MNNTDQDNGYRLDWPSIRKDWPLWVVLVGLLVVGAVAYPHLPEQIPSHWNIYGQADSYSSRNFGAFFAPLISIAIYLMMLVMPVIDPKRNNYARFPGAYRMLRWAIPLLLSVLYLVTILVSLGYRINVALIVKAMVSVLFVVIGNLMGQMRFNYFVGVRTPWTLSNEEVWRLTYRLSGKIWVIGGLVCFATAFVQTTWSAGLFFATVLVMTLVPIGYSYLTFAKLQK